jgi:hypothetical protein
MASRSADFRPHDELVDPALSFLSNQFHNHTKKLGCFTSMKMFFLTLNITTFLEEQSKVYPKKSCYTNLKNSRSDAKVANFLERTVKSLSQKARLLHKNEY